MSRDAILYLEDIQSASSKIIRFTQGMDMSGFLADERTYDAVVRNLEIIGEAAKNLPEEYKVKYAQIEWRSMAALRNIIAREYFGIKDEIVWDIIRNKIPVLQAAVQEILDTP